VDTRSLLIMHDQPAEVVEAIERQIGSDDRKQFAGLG
jgi:hypothetical protein